MPGWKARLKALLDFMGSMRFGLALFLMIAIIAAISGSRYQGNFTHSHLFQTLSLLLLGNLTLCTWKRAAAIVPLIRSSAEGTGRSMALFILHAGFVCILLGVLIFSFFGREGLLTITKGGVGRISEVLGKGENLSVRLDDFRIDYNHDNTPSQFTSRVTLINGAQGTGSYDISVNHPLNYHGIKIYQESYAWAVCAVAGDKNDKNIWGGQPLTAREGDFLNIPGTSFRILIYRFIPNYNEVSGGESVSPRPLNPRVVYAIYQGQENLNVGITRLGGDVKINNRYYLRFTGYLPVSTLKVKTDPGAPLVLGGGCLLLLGIVWAFYQPCRRAGKSRREDGFDHRLAG